MSVFSPTGSTVNLAVTNSTGSVALPQAGNKGLWNVRVNNLGSATVFINFGTSAVTATTAAGMPITAAAPEVFSVPDGATHVAAITASGTATVYFTASTGE